MKNAFGTTTITAQPHRIVCIGWGSQDIALALGVIPVGIPKGTFGDTDGFYPWETAVIGGQPKPTLLDATTVPFEQIAALHPDVILAVQSGIEKSDYDKLSAIAPTVAYPDKPWLTPWPQQTLLVGDALGMSAAAQALVDKTNALIAADAKANPELAGKTFAYGTEDQPGTYDFYSAADPRVQLVEQLGLTLSPKITALFTDPASFYTQVSMEKLDQVDAQIWIAYYAGAAAEKALKAQPVYAKVPAILRGADVSLTDDTLTMATSSPSVLSLPWALTRFVPMLAAAAANS